MISADISGQIFYSNDTSPYCFMGEEAIHKVIQPPVFLNERVPVA